MFSVKAYFSPGQPPAEIPVTEGTTIGQYTALVRPILRLPEAVDARVDGATLPSCTPLQPGMAIQFFDTPKPKGTARPAA